MCKRLRHTQCVQQYKKYNVSITYPKYIVYLQKYFATNCIELVFFVIKISCSIKYVQGKLIFLNEEEILYPHNNVTFSHLSIKSSPNQKNIQASVDFSKFVFDNAVDFHSQFYCKMLFCLPIKSYGMHIFDLLELS